MFQLALFLCMFQPHVSAGVLIYASSVGLTVSIAVSGLMRGDVARHGSALATAVADCGALSLLGLCLKARSELRARHHSWLAGDPRSPWPPRPLNPLPPIARTATHTTRLQQHHPLSPHPRTHDNAD